MAFYYEKYQKIIKFKIYVTISTHFCSIIDTDPYLKTKISIGHRDWGHYWTLRLQKHRKEGINTYDTMVS